MTSTSMFFLDRSFSRRRLKDDYSCCGGMFFIPTTLAVLTAIFIVLYISSTSELFIHTHVHVYPPLEFSTTLSPPIPPAAPRPAVNVSLLHRVPAAAAGTPPLIRRGFSEPDGDDDEERENDEPVISSTLSTAGSGSKNVKVDRSKVLLADKGHILSEVENHHRTKQHEEDDVFHDRAIFRENYKQMNRSLKIYVYPHRRNHPFAGVLLPVSYEPSGNYASESYFKKVLMQSHFITDNPSEADLFYLPFSIAGLRNDRRVGVGGIKDFVRDYIFEISHSYPYWNRTGGADHFYLACHSVGRSAMEKAVEVMINSIQVVCSSSYFLPGYVAHKDASVPQIWPRKGEPKYPKPSERKNLAFFAGAMNSRVRENLVKTWKNDSEINVNQGRLRTPYDQAHLDSKFCIHAKGFEVNTARVGDAIYYGCVPVILADHYDLPYADVLNWKSFSVVVSTWDIKLLKKVLKEIGPDRYLRLQRNVMEVRKHFRWHQTPAAFDAFYMVMYELWLRRSLVRVQFDDIH